MSRHGSVPVRITRRPRGGGGISACHAGGPRTAGRRPLALGQSGTEVTAVGLRIITGTQCGDGRSLSSGIGARARRRRPRSRARTDTHNHNLPRARTAGGAGAELRPVGPGRRASVPVVWRAYITRRWQSESDISLILIGRRHPRRFLCPLGAAAEPRRQRTAVPPAATSRGAAERLGCTDIARRDVVVGDTVPHRAAVARAPKVARQSLSRQQLECHARSRMPLPCPVPLLASASAASLPCLPGAL